MNKNVKLPAQNGRYLHFAFEFRSALLKKQIHKCLCSDVNYDKKFYRHQILIKEHINLKESIQQAQFNFKKHYQAQLY